MKKFTEKKTQSDSIFRVYDTYAEYDAAAKDLATRKDVVTLETYCDKENGVFTIRYLACSAADAG